MRESKTKLTSRLFFFFFFFLSIKTKMHCLSVIHDITPHLTKAKFTLNRTPLSIFAKVLNYLFRFPIHYSNLVLLIINWNLLIKQNVSAATRTTSTYRIVCVVHHSSSPEIELDHCLAQSYEYSIKITRFNTQKKWYLLSKTTAD